MAKKAAKVAKQAKPTKQDAKAPGVLYTMVKLLTEAEAPGVSVAEMVERLAKATGRKPDHLANTVKT